ncbi:threonine synthase [Deferrisoma palaeochoriense]
MRDPGRAPAPAGPARLRCLDCGREVPPDRYLRECPRPGCAGVLAFHYPHGPGPRFPDPALPGTWRFAPLLPVASPLGSPLRLAPTPLVHSRLIGPRLGLRALYLKVESVHPTRTFKDREALVAVSRFLEIGVDRLVTATTGDSGAAYLRAAVRAGMEITVFVPRNAAERWGEITEEVLANEPGGTGTFRTIVAGETFDQAIPAAEEHARATGTPMEYGFRNQLRVEGMKTLAFEVLEALGGVPDVYLQAVGSGVGLFAFRKACLEWKGARPTLVGVQPKGCNPVVRAFRGDPEPVGHPATRVLGIANPSLPSSWPRLRAIGCRFVDGFASEDEPEPKAAKRILEELEDEGIPDAGMEAACALSGLEGMVRDEGIPPEAAVVVAVSGGLRRADLRR